MGIVEKHVVFFAILLIIGTPNSLICKGVTGKFFKKNKKCHLGKWFHEIRAVILYIVRIYTFIR
jgi:hypothetical protein